MEGLPWMWGLVKMDLFLLAGGKCVVRESADVLQKVT